MDLNITPKNTGTVIINARNIDGAVRKAAQQLINSLDTIAEVPADFNREETGDSRGVFHAETGKRLYDLKVADQGTNGVYAIEITPTDREALGYLRRIRH